MDLSAINKKIKYFYLKRNPILLYTGLLECKPGWHSLVHQHTDHCELLYISAGQGEVFIDDMHYEIHAGDLIIYNKNVTHTEKSSTDNPLKIYYVGVSDISLSGLEEGHFIPKCIDPLIHVNKYSGKVELYLGELTQEFQACIPGYDVICNCFLSAFLVLILRLVSTENTDTYNTDNSLGYQIKRYIDRNYTENITLGMLADGFYVSKYYLSHMFKNATGYSPMNYIISLRIEKAKLLLMNSNMTIKDISNQIGFNNAKHFTALFKKFIGVSPSIYKKQSKK